MKDVINILIGASICFSLVHFDGLEAQTLFSSVSADSISNARIVKMDSTDVELRSQYSFNLFSTAVKAILALTLIGCLIFMTIYLLKRFFFFKKNNPFFNEATKILGTIPLSPKSSIYLVKIIDQILVVGLCENHMVLLTTIQDHEVMAKLECVNKPENFTATTFKNYLNRMLKKHDE